MLSDRVGLDYGITSALSGRIREDHSRYSENSLTILGLIGIDQEAQARLEWGVRDPWEKWDFSRFRAQRAKSREVIANWARFYETAFHALPRWEIRNAMVTFELKLWGNEAIFPDATTASVRGFYDAKVDALLVLSNSPDWNGELELVLIEAKLPGRAHDSEQIQGYRDWAGYIEERLTDKVRFVDGSPWGRRIVGAKILMLGGVGAAESEVSKLAWENEGAMDGLLEIMPDNQYMAEFSRRLRAS